ncbi:LysR family transcriptional regulator [Ruegeria sp. 2205SS24-7]|uniref:LysR family transcriptional regulator n=1 Tax=Ruegeria discodermiae TaxID=3064389 RepID=UPI0027410530|nr:LysR family transcriptional regulator [Ruegeria sp. 2205SS24-7]MDP5218487.1 LysR family transcriptional regulator [Ruegeria sp. 2205SS24-7]
MKLDPKHLAQLSVIVEAGSYQSAASRLGTTQPALSRNMKALEDRLGTPLFQKVGRRSIPNNLALRLARNGLAIRLAEEQAGVLADQSANGSIGELRIGAPPIVSGRFLSNALTQFIKTNPNCSVEIRTGLVHELRTLLERGEVDLVFGPESLAEPVDGLEFEELIDDGVGVMCRIGHPLTALKRVMASDLEAQIWLAHSRGSLLRQQTEAAMIASGVRSMRIGCETDSIRSVLEIVSETDLITTMPRATTAPYLEDRLLFLNFDHQQFHRPLGVIRRVGISASRIEDRFLHTLKKSLAVHFPI